MPEELDVIKTILVILAIIGTVLGLVLVFFGAPRWMVPAGMFGLPIAAFFTLVIISILGSTGD